EMALPWGVWLLVFCLHSVLYWGGWFASLGLMRILATTAPVTAVICLHGWNDLALALARRGWSEAGRRRVAVAALGVAVCVALLQYVLRPQHLRSRAMRRAVAELVRRAPVEEAPRLVISDKMVLAELGMPPRSGKVLDPGYDADELRRRLRAAP